MTSSKILFLLWGMLFAIMNGGCQPATPPGDAVSLESILPRSYRYIGNWEPDSLLHLANEVIRLTPEQSEAHFFARGTSLFPTTDGSRQCFAACARSLPAAGHTAYRLSDNAVRKKFGGCQSARRGFPFAIFSQC